MKHFKIIIPLICLCSVGIFYGCSSNRAVTRTANISSEDIDVKIANKKSQLAGLNRKSNLSPAEQSLKTTLELEISILEKEKKLLDEIAVLKTRIKNSDVGKVEDLEDDIEDLEDEVDDLEEQLEDANNRGSNRVDAEDYLDSTVFIFLLNGACGAENKKTVYGSCVLNCYTTSSGSNLRTCLTSCDSTHSCHRRESNLGSGVFYTANKVLTNHHVIHTAIGNGFMHPTTNEYLFNIDAIVKNYSGTIKSLQSVLWYDTRDDIALIELNEDMPDADPVVLGSLSEVDLLDYVFTIGSPSGVQWVVSEGQITNKTPPADLCRNCITHSIPTGGGNSGGGIFSRETGNLIGLIAAVLTNSGIPVPNLEYGPHVNRIKRLIERNPSGDGTNVQSYQATQRAFSGLSNRRRQDILEREIEYIKSITRD